MNGLNWFQARDLAYQGRAIRRVGWTAWIFRRFHCWLYTDNISAFRVVQNTDFGPGEFMAKDWTDEAWTGGTYPPCTLVPPAPALAPSSSMGQASWTMDANCAGDGDAGNIPVLSTPATGTVDVPPSMSMQFELSTALGTALIPDGTTCWTTVPTSDVVLAVLIDRSALEAEYYVLYIAPPAADITRPPISGRFFSSGPLVLTPNLGFLQCGFLGRSGSGTAIYYFGAVHTPNTSSPQDGYGRQVGQDALVMITPATTWVARLYAVDATDSDFSHGSLIAACTLVVPPFCSSTTAPPGP